MSAVVAGTTKCRTSCAGAFPHADVLEAIANEVAIAAYIAADMIACREIDKETWERLALAHRRISDARALVTPARLPP